MRTWITDLEATMAGEGDALDPALAEARGGAQQSLADTVTALERLRLQLRQFHDGIGSVDGITAELAAAREVTEAVDRLLAGWAEVRRSIETRHDRTQEPCVFSLPAH